MNSIEGNLCRDITTDRLISEIEHKVVKMAGYLGRRCGVDADDLLQDAWLAVLEMIPRLDPEIGSPELHLIKRAKWRMLDSIRYHRRRVVVSLDQSLEVGISMPSTDGIDISDVLPHISPVQQQILRGLLEGYTWREVGNIVGCSSANVAYHVKKIRSVYNTLKDQLHVC